MLDRVPWILRANIPPTDHLLLHMTGTHEMLVHKIVFGCMLELAYRRSTSGGHYWPTTGLGLFAECLATRQRPQNTLGKSFTECHPRQSSLDLILDGKKIFVERFFCTFGKGFANAKSTLDKKNSTKFENSNFWRRPQQFSTHPYPSKYIFRRLLWPVEFELVTLPLMHACPHLPQHHTITCV